MLLTHILKPRQCGESVVLDAEESIGLHAQVDPSVCAILVKKDSGTSIGFVKTIDRNGKAVKNALTGQGRGWVIVVRNSEETCWIFGNSSVRYFRRRSATTA